MDFYEKLTIEKAKRKLRNKDLGDIIGMEAETFRVAMSRKSLNKFQIKEIEKFFDNEKQSNSGIEEKSISHENEMISFYKEKADFYEKKSNELEKKTNLESKISDLHESLPMLKYIYEHIREVRIEGKFETAREALEKKEKEVLEKIKK